MKIGFRKPNLKKSIKARTTGKLKRKVKKQFIPYYGKKGSGLIKDPKKAIYNKVYNKTTIDPIKGLRTKQKPSKKANLPKDKKTYIHDKYTQNYESNSTPRVEKRSILVRILQVFFGIGCIWIAFTEYFFLHLMFFIYLAIGIYLTYRGFRKPRIIISVEEAEEIISEYKEG